MLIVIFMLDNDVAAAACLCYSQLLSAVPVTVNITVGKYKFYNWPKVMERRSADGHNVQNGRWKNRHRVAEKKSRNDKKFCGKKPATFELDYVCQ